MESKEPYVTADDTAILARLLEVFTPGQLLKLAEAMGEAGRLRYGRIEIEVRGDRMFIWFGRSVDAGDVIGRA